MTAKPPVLVSAIIPAYNAERFVADAIRSAINQAGCEIEVIVVDDGSSDRTVEIARRFGDRVRVISQANQGVAAARNAGIAAARGEYLAFLDADDAWLPQKCITQVGMLEESREAVAAGCGAVLTDENLNPIRIQLARPTTFTKLMLWESTGGLGGSGPLVRADAMRSVDGYDIALSTSADWDVAVRLSVIGSTVTAEEPLFLYRQHGSNMHRQISVMEHDMRILMSKARDLSETGRRLYRPAMARTWTVLAGSYWHAGQRLQAFRCALNAVANAPGQAPALAVRGMRTALRRGSFRRD
jgi:glycosyltransferase involved in cell wall biosynthesis